jgi:hypothetical protein
LIFPIGSNASVFTGKLALCALCVVFAIACLFLIFPIGSNASVLTGEFFFLA